MSKDQGFENVVAPALVSNTSSLQRRWATHPSNQSRLVGRNLAARDKVMKSKPHSGYIFQFSNVGRRSPMAFLVFRTLHKKCSKKRQFSGKKISVAIWVKMLCSANIAVLLYLLPYTVRVCQNNFNQLLSIRMSFSGNGSLVSVCQTSVFSTLTPQNARPHAVTSQFTLLHGKGAVSKRCIFIPMLAREKGCGQQQYCSIWITTRPNI